MNIEEYRAMKAQEATQATQQKEQPPVVKTEVKPTETPTTETKPEVKPVEKPVEKPIEKITINGIGEVTIDELKNGYLRTADYTKKTQELAKQKRQVEEIIKSGKVPDALDPTQAKVVELEEKLYDMMLQNEINMLQTKYKDFEVLDVLQVARDKNLSSLEDAYKLIKSTKEVAPVDVDAIKKQAREELLKELEAEKNATRTVISSTPNQTVLQDNTPKLTEAEKKVARNMFRKEKNPEAEYVKWRDMKH